MDPNSCYEFGRHRLDVAQRVLLREGQVVHITPKAFEILLVLVENSGRIVSKETLMQKVWPDCFVEETNLAFNINIIRRALGQEDATHQYIETVRKRGYRFRGPVSSEGPNGESVPLSSIDSGAVGPPETRGSPVQAEDPGTGSQFAAAAAVWARVRKLLAPGRRRASDNRQEFFFPRAAPFRGLLPFDKADADRFFGREIDKLRLADLITYEESTFAVLYGDSGCGKTSLIRAGVVPCLEDKGYTPIYCRSYKEPLTAILEEARQRTGIAPLKDEAPVTYLGRICGNFGSALLIICDQFEEFFINFRTARKRAPFISLVAACHNSNLPIRFLFSMRSDFLHLIATAFDDQLPDPLNVSRRYHLRNFDESQAAEIIERSLRGAEWLFDGHLCEAIAADLATNGEVLPSELQIVGEQLQKKRLSTVEAFERAGKKEQLVYDYLEDVIRPVKDRETSHLVLRALISDEDTRLTLTLKEISRRAMRKEQVVQQTVELLARARLIRVIQDENPWRYELTHEYLIHEVNQVTGRVMDSRHRANRLLRHYLMNQSIDGRTRIPIGKLWFIARYSDLAKSGPGRELLKKSLRRGLTRSFALSASVVMLAILTAAGLSVTDEWEEFRLQDGHSAAARQAVFSPDGRRLVSGGEDGLVIVWDFDRRQRVATLNSHNGIVGAVAFSPDNKWLATGGDDQTIIVWDAARFEKAAELVGRGKITGLAFSPDAKLLAASGGGASTLWEVGTWSKRTEILMDSMLSGPLFTPDGRHVLSPSTGATMWDVKTGDRLEQAVSPALSGNSGALSSDGKLLITVDVAGSLNFFDLTRRELIQTLRAHRDHGRAVACSHDGRFIASGADNIVLWDARTRQKLLPLQYAAVVWSLAFSPDGRWLVSTHGDGAILVWDVTERELVANFNEHSGPVRAVAFSPDGKRVASASEDRSIIVWDAENRRKETVLVGHNTRVTSIAFSPDGSWLASSDFDGTVFVWDPAAGQRRRTLKTFSEGTVSYCLAISPDGRWVATSHGIYDSADGRCVVSFLDPGTSWDNYSAIYGMAFSPDGRWLVYPTTHGSLVLVETGTWQLVQRLEESEAVFVSISFSPDGKRFATGDDRGVVGLWGTNPLRRLAVIGRHAARVKSVAFSPDGNEIASASDDRSICLWNVSSRRRVARIGSHTAPVLSVAFSSDAKSLASGDHDNSVHVYTRHRSLWGWRLPG